MIGGVRCNRCKRLYHDACTGLSTQLDMCIICKPAQHLFGNDDLPPELQPLTVATCKVDMEVVHEQHGTGVVVEVLEQDEMLYHELRGKCRVT